MPGLHGVSPEMWSEGYQSELLAMHARVFDRIPAVVGEQVWNFADFATSQGIMRVGGNRKGVFTRDRQPKAAAHVLRQRWLAQRAQAVLAQATALSVPAEKIQPPVRATAASVAAG